MNVKVYLFEIHHYFKKLRKKKKKNEKENVNQIISISPKLPFM